MRQFAFFVLAMVLGLTISLMLLPSHPVQAAGAVYYVDDDYGNLPPGSGTPTDPFHEIQVGINAASSGDTVQVAAGTYHENITMKSGVVIQGAGQGVSIINVAIGSVVTANGVDSAAKLDGFTITNGLNTYGGGMYNNNSSPTVTNCTFSGNSATWGGGMYNENSSPTVNDCTFSENLGNDSGGGMYNNNSSPTVTNCTFSENWAHLSGSGMYNDSSSPTVTNCTFSGNIGSFGVGGGMYNNNSSSPTVTNCTFSENIAGNYGGGMGNDNSSPIVTNSILWGNSPDEIRNLPADADLTPSVTYSDIQGGYTGTGNINADPLFVDVANGDLHLKPFSPCIDAGDNSAQSLPSTDFEGDNRKIDEPTVTDTGNGTPPIADIGADEFEPLAADFTATPTSGEEPLSVDFTEQSTGYITSWDWAFGDGSTSTEQNPTYTYTDAGIYTVSLTVTGPGGSTTVVKDDLITVQEDFPWELFLPAILRKK